MTWEALAKALFPAGHKVNRSGDLVHGQGTLGDMTIAVIGTADHAYIGVELALALAGEVLAVVRSFPKRPILFLVDTRGQRLSRRDELLGINGYLAHLALCLALARARGHRVIGLAYGEAVSGGFLAGGMMADATVALPEAQVLVMDLAAMARVMRVPLERLRELGASSPVFAPGAESFLKLAGIAEIWIGDLSAHLQRTLKAAPESVDRRAEVAFARGGRVHAARVIARVREHD